MKKGHETGVMKQRAVACGRIPAATYRLQFNRDYTFARATELVPYLAALGISHCYASPYLRARPGSLHGYDIIDHHQLNPEIGGPEDYERFVTALHEHGMGQILDIVPNHMGIMGKDNAWWLDVLENGPSSEYADYFDIDWEPLKAELRGKVLVPVLGDQYGAVLDRGELRLSFDAERGEFSIVYFEHRFPIDPREYATILGRGLAALEKEIGGEDQSFLELQSLMSAFLHLPGREETAPAQRAERMRDKEIHKRRLAELCKRSAAVAHFIERNVAAINGVTGQAASFDELHELIKAQAYRFASWRVAADDINYRRFFDINDLAALRQEKKAVFTSTHEFVLQLLREGKINGLRIDHPDGLYNPLEYFERLQRAQSGSGEQRAEAKPYYVVAEKILTGAEQLAPDWPIDGTTGYGFANLLNALFVDTEGERRMDRIYRLFSGRREAFRETLIKCKKLVMDQYLKSELNVLANHLSRIALADRHTCDFTLKAVRDALAEVIACFPVYRTYVTENHVSDCDREFIARAIACAKSASLGPDRSIYEFIEEVLLTSRGEGRSEAYRCSIVRFAMRFQQYTSPLMAKGMEDTCFYRYNRLVSLNEVGGDPLRFGVSAAAFHEQMQRRAETWPHEINTTSTHDSKRSEDVRARINVLSELPLEWLRQVRGWRNLNRDKKSRCGDEEFPTLNDEYLFYQTLLGAWPLPGAPDAPPDQDQPAPARRPNEMAAEKPPASFVERVRNYMIKAIREAKENTNWNNRNEAYESAMSRFVDAVLGSEAFLEAFLPFQREIACFGMVNGLAQTMIKLTAPGVPDIYQGNELWEFALADPDNRHAVDYGPRRQALKYFEECKSESCAQLKSRAQQLVQNASDGRIKLYVIWKTLGLRRRKAELFCAGEYVSLRALGVQAGHVLAFARRGGGETAIVAVPRLSAKLLQGEARLLFGDEAWGDTRIQVPVDFGARFRNLFTGEILQGERVGSSEEFGAAQMFADFPVALLGAAEAAP